MPVIIVEAVAADGNLPRWTLRERVIPEHLESPHHARQLLDRLAWAVADAARQESGSEPFEQPSIADDQRHVAGRPG